MKDWMRLLWPKYAGPKTHSLDLACTLVWLAILFILLLLIVSPCWGC